MLIMPNDNVPAALWDVAEKKEMEEVHGLYGKTFHFWQVDRGDELPLGMPQLMMSFTKDEQVSLPLVCRWIFKLTSATKGPLGQGERSRSALRRGQRKEARAEEGYPRVSCS
jgi:hypothetical protein